MPEDLLPLLTLHEAASLLRMSPSWLKRRVSAGTAPHVRFGRSIRFTHAQVEAISTAGTRGESAANDAEPAHVSTARTRL